MLLRHKRENRLFQLIQCHLQSEEAQNWTMDLICRSYGCFPGDHEVFIFFSSSYLRQQPCQWLYVKRCLQDTTHDKENDTEIMTAQGETVFWNKEIPNSSSINGTDTSKGNSVNQEEGSELASSGARGGRTNLHWFVCCRNAGVGSAHTSEKIK